MSSFGGTVKLTGESEYKKALAAISSNLKVLNSEMKAVTSVYDKNDKSVANLSSQNEVLNKKIDEQEKKVSILKDALAKSKEETGENSNTTKKWQIELNNAQAELNKLVKNVEDNEDAMRDSAAATDKNTDSIDEFGKEADESGKSALKLGDIIKANLISEGIKAGIKGLASAIKSVGSAFVSIGKQALASYGEYEQLVGGIDTLFGESAKKVQEYANNAYKTAGLSANQYMETVTSFSASMISSLGGDTEKASEVANRAIIDMSDNANKMGTSMESIQNAYQGFAKQNYTMLDNLKLGYGGTKTEMQRLIADAAKMTDVQKELGVTIDANDMSFANIANAISVVQTNMGIAGATSKEASITMTGSVSAMKGAWQNLITGIADENANFEQLVNNLVVSIVGEGGEGGVLNNFLPRIETALDGIVKMVVSLTQNLLPQIAQIAVDLILTLATGINENLPALMGSVSEILNVLVNGISSLLPELVPIVIQVVTTLIESIAQMLPTLIDAVLSTVVALVEALAGSLPQIITTIVGMIPELINKILEALPLLIQALLSLVLSIVKALPSIITNLINALPSIIQSVINALLTAIPLIITAAIELLMGIIEAIPTIVTAITENIPTIINSIIDGLLDALPLLLESAIELLMAIIEALPTILTLLVAEIPKIQMTISATLLSRLPQLLKAAVELLMGIVKAIPQIIVELGKKVPEIITKIVSSLKDGFGKITQVGTDLVSGIWSGISGSLTWLKNKIKGWVGNVTSFIKRLFGINSPSKLFKDEIGTNLALGVGEGFGDTMSDVAKDMANAIPTEFDADINTNINSMSGQSQISTYDMMVSAFKQSLKEVKVVMDDREMGTFVTDTVTRAVYA